MNDKKEFPDNEHSRCWNHRVLEEVKDGISYFSIIEVHYEEEKLWAYCDNDNNLLSGWSDFDSLKWTCEHVKEAFNHPIVKKDENGELYEDDES